MTGIVRATGLVKRYDKTVAVAGLDLDVGSGRDLRSCRTQRRRQDDDAADPGHAARPGPGRCRDRGGLRPAEPQRRAPRPRVHAGLVRGLRRHEGLGVPGLLRPLLRDPGRPPPAHDRRPPGAGGPGLQARRLRPGPVAGHAAAPVPRPHARPRPAGAAARRAGLRPGPAGPRRAAGAAPRAARRWARRSSSPPTSFPSWRSCAPRSPSSTAGRSSPTDASPRSSDGCASGRSCARGSWATPTRIEAARAWFSAQPDVVTADLLADGTIEIGFHGDDEGSARLLAHAVGADLRVASFARAASDLEELFLQVTAPDPEPAEASA